MDAGIGYILDDEHNPSLPILLRLACVEARSKEDNRVYNTKQELEDLAYSLLSTEGSDYDIRSFLFDYEVVLHNDVVYDGRDGFYFKHNDRFAIGQPHRCGTMIYDKGYNHQISFQLDEIRELLEWVEKLMDEDRIDPDREVEFSIFAPCC